MPKDQIHSMRYYHLTFQDSRTEGFQQMCSLLVRRPQIIHYSHLPIPLPPLLFSKKIHKALIQLGFHQSLSSLQSLLTLRAIKNQTRYCLALNPGELSVFLAELLIHSQFLLCKTRSLQRRVFRFFILEFLNPRSHSTLSKRKERRNLGKSAQVSSH